jgi:hypothetical protein
VLLHWSAKVHFGWIASYALEAASNDEPFASLPALSAWGAYATVYRQPGEQHRFRLQATATDGARSAWATSEPFRYRLLQDADATAFAYGRRWVEGKSRRAQGGTIHRTGADGARANVTFTGTEVALIAPTGPGHGRLQVSVDGRPPVTIKLGSARAVARKVVARFVVGPGPHRLTLTARIGLAGNIVAVDAVAVADQ